MNGRWEQISRFSLCFNFFYEPVFNLYLYRLRRLSFGILEPSFSFSFDHGATVCVCLRLWSDHLPLQRATVWGKLVCSGHLPLLWATVLSDHLSLPRVTICLCFETWALWASVERSRLWASVERSILWASVHCGGGALNPQLASE